MGSEEDECDAECGCEAEPPERALEPELELPPAPAGCDCEIIVDEPAPAAANAPEPTAAAGARGGSVAEPAFRLVLCATRAGAGVNVGDFVACTTVGAFSGACGANLASCCAITSATKSDVTPAAL